ncbi:MAG: hypothetical protein ACRELA_18270 [Candidatus Rokuibacteriota bacterium]
MSERAAQLVDRVLPHVPICQWVFTVPVPLRDPLAPTGFEPTVLRPARRRRPAVNPVT